MEAHICSRCGGTLTKKDGFYVCGYCRTTYEDDAEESASLTLKGLLDEAKLERLANARRALYDQVHRENPSEKKTLACVHDVLNLYPDDTLARFYDATLDEDPAVLNEFLKALEVETAIAEEIVRYGVKGLKLRNVMALKDFVERHFEGQEKTKKWSQIEEEAAKLDEGIYSTSVPRDVFLAYSSADQERVAEMCDFLESEGFTVFVAYRNLRHGVEAQENYLTALYDALRHCKVFLFLSSNNSRSLACDALRVEAPYVTDNLKDMKKIEYLLDDYSPKTSTSVKILLKRAFPSEWCTNRDDLVERILDATTQSPVTCPKCFAVIPHGSAFCLRCGTSINEGPKPETKPEPKPKPKPKPEPKPQAKPAKAEHAICLMCGAYNAVGATICTECGFEPSQYGLGPIGTFTDVELSNKIEAMEEADGAFESDSDKTAEPMVNEGCECPTCGTFNPAGNKVCSLCGFDPSKFGYGPFGTFTTEEVDKTLYDILDQEPDAEPKPAPKKTVSSTKDFVIANAILMSYRGHDADIAIPEGVIVIDGEAFKGCKTLVNLTVSSTVRTISASAFASCPNLESVTFQGPIEVLDVGAFQECPKLHKIVIPDGLRRIWPYCFYNDVSLKVMVIPEGIKDIGTDAFGGCTGLDYVMIPSTVNVTGACVFEHCACNIDIAIKKPLFGLPKGFHERFLEGFKGKARWNRSVDSLADDLLRMKGS